MSNFTFFRPGIFISSCGNYLKAFALLLAFFVFSLPATAQTIYALSGNNLISFNATLPSVITNTVSITGIAGGQSISGLDSRPATGQLYALGYVSANGNSQLYTINPATGAASAVNSTPVMLAPNMGKISFDFNPTVDRIRVTGSNNKNYRLHPITGAIAATDGELVFVPGDANAGTDPSVGTGAYTNSYIASTATTLYNYDDSLNVLTSQNPPNAGSLNTVGSSGITINLSDPSSDLDIYYNALTQSNVAYFVANAGNSSNDNLYTINLTTGVATLAGLIGVLGQPIQDIAVAIDNTIPTLTGQLVYAVTSNNSLISFDSNNPSVVRSLVTISGLLGGQTAEGLDFRPATGELYALGYSSSTSRGQIYTVNPATGAATAVGIDTILALGSSAIGFDFNPVPDRIRIVGGSDTNYRINPITGAIAATDGNLAYATGDANMGADPLISSVAYTNSFSGSTTTTLYDYDATLNILAIQNPPNAGTLNTVGASGISGTTVDMDIYYDFLTSTNMAYLASSAGNFYSVNLTLGTATLIGRIGNNIAVKDIAVLIDSIPLISAIGEVRETNVAFSVFPNPASNAVNINYDIKQSGRVEIVLSDLMGRKMAVIEQGERTKGSYQKAWSIDAAPGLYLVQVYNDGILQGTNKLLVK